MISVPLLVSRSFRIAPSPTTQKELAMKIASQKHALLMSADGIAKKIALPTLTYGEQQRELFATGTSSIPRNMRNQG